MKIEHIAVYVDDLDSAKKFFEKYFGAVASEKYHNIKTEFQSYFLSFEGDARLEIMTKPCVADTNNKGQHKGYAHIAFSVGNKKSVDELTQRLAGDGYKVISGPRTTGDGYYESCVQGFENNIIEITE